MNISDRTRFKLYLVASIVSALVGYLLEKNLIGDAEVGLWARLTSIINIVAALNVGIQNKAKLIQ